MTGETCTPWLAAGMVSDIGLPDASILPDTKLPVVGTFVKALAAFFETGFLTGAMSREALAFGALF